MKKRSLEWYGAALILCREFKAKVDQLTEDGRAPSRDTDGSPTGRDREDGLDGEAATAVAEDADGIEGIAQHIDNTPYST